MPRTVCYLEVEHITIDLDHIYLGVIILYTFTSYCIRTQVITEGLIITKVTRQIIQILVIVDPESNIPGLIILPTVVGNVEGIALVSDSHCSLVVLILLVHFTRPPFS